MNGIYKVANLQNWEHSGKLEILIQKIKVKKYYFDLYFLIIKSDLIQVSIAQQRKKHLSIDIYYI